MITNRGSRIADRGSQSQGSGSRIADRGSLSQGSWIQARRALAPVVLIMLGALLVLFEREWRHGEVFSPADLIFEFHPWAHDTERTRATNPTRSDEAFYHQPLMTTHFARLRDGELPDYDDTRLAGVPSFFQGLDVGRAFSPFSLPFYLLPADQAVSWYGPVRLLVAALAMWLFLRDLGASPVAAALGGVAFGLNGHFLTWLSAPMPTVAAWLPLALRQVRRSVHRGRWPDVAGLALALGAMFLGGYLATVLVCLAGIGIYATCELCWTVGPTVARRLRRARQVRRLHQYGDALADREGRTGHETPTDHGGRPDHEGRPLGSPLRSPLRPDGTQQRGLRPLRDGAERPRVRAVGALAAGGVLGLLVGAAALGPMLYALSTSPAAARVVSPEGAGWANLATLALPDFWGTPLRGNWWHPDASASYPEHVAYFGIPVLLLAGVGVASRFSPSISLVRWTFAGLTMLALTRAYGAPPGRWLVWLPGQAQSNPLRWYALAACALAVLAGLGLHALLTDDERRRRLLSLAGALGILAALGAVTAAALLVFLPQIREANLQAFEREQIVRFGVIAAATIGIAAWTAWTSHARARAIGGLLLVVLAAGDLVQAHRGFNPTVPPDRYYPTTPAIKWLRERAADARIAPVDPEADLVEGHVWSMYGLSTITGFDYHGDRDFQRFMQMAQAPAGAGTGTGGLRPVWDYVGLRREPVDLRMLGVLGARFLVTAPVDLMPRAGGYSTIEPVSGGRQVRFTFPVIRSGLRGIDLLTATHARHNRGRWVWTLTGQDGVTRASGAVEQGSLKDNAWLRLEWPPLQASAGQRFTLAIAGEGPAPPEGATLLATAAPGALSTVLELDGRIDGRTLWFRTFSDAPDRFGEAPLMYAGDLNIYRNPHARPRAWFVQRVHVAEPALHASQMHTRTFDTAGAAWLDRSPAVAPTASARVTSITLEDDERTIGVDAPEGGVLVVSDRAHSGWNATIDGRPLPILVANGVLMGFEIPPGGRTLTLTFQHPSLRLSIGISCLALAGITFASLVKVRGER